LKILHVNTSDIDGGAARAANRLHKALLSQGVDSRMLVQSKKSDDETVLGPNSKLQKLHFKARPTIDYRPLQKYKNRTASLFSPCLLPFSDLTKRIDQVNPDIVHLHWVQSGMLNISDLCKIQVPIVWTMHDMWPLTGGCHYDESCGRYDIGCGSCKVLSSKTDNDLSRKIFRIKQSSLSNFEKLQMVGVSAWLQKEGQKSLLFKKRNVLSIGNALDCQTFKIIDKATARKLFNLPDDKKLILFGAISATKDKRKGFLELYEAIENLNTNDVEIVIFGASEKKDTLKFSYKTHYLGYLRDDQSLVALYNAVDVMVVPSLQEAFGQTASESMACGTPVVAFGATGLLDIVDHQINGYLAQPFDIQDLANGINWVLKHDNKEQLSQAARHKVLREFDSNVVAGKYIEVYERVLKRDE
jgi:glycosyltransferase involved in cell wall biosynthesis